MNLESIDLPGNLGLVAGVDRSEQCLDRRLQAVEQGHAVFLQAVSLECAPVERGMGHIQPAKRRDRIF